MARVGHTAILTGGTTTEGSPHGPQWDLVAERAAAHGRELAPGEGRAFHINAIIGRPTAEAIAIGRDAHDEYVKFLSPYGRFKHYPGSGFPANAEGFGCRPTIEESIELGSLAVGPVEQVADLLGGIADRLSLRHLMVFPDFPGFTREQVDEQMRLLATEVLPRIGVTLDRRSV